MGPINVQKAITQKSPRRASKVWFRCLWHDLTSRQTTWCAKLIKRHECFTQYHSFAPWSTIPRWGSKFWLRNHMGKCSPNPKSKPREFNPHTSAYTNEVQKSTMWSEQVLKDEGISAILQSTRDSEVILLGPFDLSCWMTCSTVTESLAEDLVSDLTLVQLGL